MTATRKECRTCGGTGWQHLMKSWFATDGLRRAVCGICGGSGVSSYQDDPEFVRGQAKLRAMAKETSNGT